MKHKILITGATGFIGQSLSKTLAKKNHHLVAAVRKMSHTLPPEIQQITIKQFNKNECVELMDNIDCIIHLAGRAHILKEKNQHPLEIFREINVTATLNLANEAAKKGVKRFIFISSIGVNGNQSKHPFLADDIPNPVEPYAQSKLEAEQGLLAIAKQTNLEVVIIRPPLVYGANAPGNFGRLIKIVKKGTPLPLGAIYNRRSLVSLDNLISLILLTISHPNAKNSIFLVSDDNDVSTTQLLQFISKALGKKILLMPLPQYIVTSLLYLLNKPKLVQRLCGSLQVDIAKTKQQLSWSPVLTFEEGIKKSVEG